MLVLLCAGFGAGTDSTAPLRVRGRVGRERTGVLAALVVLILLLPWLATAALLLISRTLSLGLWGCLDSALAGPVYSGLLFYAS